MQKLAILGEKGGCSKSTTALGLAVAASLDGIETAVIDLDPQATAAKWSDRRDRATGSGRSNYIGISRYADTGK